MFQIPKVLDGMNVATGGGVKEMIVLTNVMLNVRIVSPVTILRQTRMLRKKLD
jgi:hypothetical protein